MLRRTALAVAGAVLLGSIGCNEGTSPNVNTAPTNAKPTNAASNTTKLEPKVLKDEAGPDNSHVKIKQLENGQQVAVRTWASGPIKKVSRRGETQSVKVIYRDGKAVQVDDADLSTHLLDWTSAQIADAAKKLGKAVGDKADDADDAADDVKDKVVDGTKKAANEVADKAEDVKDQTVKGAKKAGEALKP